MPNDSRFRVLRLNVIAERGLQVMEKHHCEVVEAHKTPDAIILRSHILKEADIAPSVLAVVRAGAGVNNIPVAECTARGIPVFNTPGGNANAVKELVMAAMLLAARGIHQGIRYVDSLADQVADNADLNQRMEAEKKQFKGADLAGYSLGVIGLGAVGAKVAGMALTMDMKAFGYDPALSLENAWRLSNRVERCDTPAALMRQSDYISVHVPVLDSTRALINRDLLSHVKPGACLLNFSRAEVVDVDAVAEALDDGKLSCYISDFPDIKMLGRDDAILMPHIGASTREAEENCAVMAAEQLGEFLLNGNIRNSVNFPSLSLERRGDCRLSVCNLNRPKMLNAILNILGEAEINVVDMSNRSREDIAYNLIDLERAPAPESLERIRDLDGVLNLRLIEANSN